jgi:hypothetical protein
MEDIRPGSLTLEKIAGDYNDTAAMKRPAPTQSKARRRIPDLFYLSTPRDMPLLGSDIFR